MDMDTYAYNSENKLFSDLEDVQTSKDHVSKASDSALTPGNGDYSLLSERESDSSSRIERHQLLPTKRASPHVDTPVRQKTVFKS